MIGERLRYLRMANRLTQREVADILKIHRTTYAYYESGQRMIPPSVLSALADLYHVSVDYLLGRTDRREPYD